MEGRAHDPAGAVGAYLVAPTPRCHLARAAAGGGASVLRDDSGVVISSRSYLRGRNCLAFLKP